MSSRRFPGKALAPFRGRPIIAHVLARVATVVPSALITVATSSDPTDDPLACYVESLGVAVYRGPLDDVVTRFQGCLARHPCHWFLRLCADSPLLDAEVLRSVAMRESAEADIVTNVFSRTYPKGHSAELVLASTFSSLDAGTLDAQQKEHLTKIYYDHPDRFRIVNVAADRPCDTSRSFVVDTLEDLRRLEASVEEVP